MFIVIEGLDGSGKTTVSKLLTSEFIKHGLNCHHTYEPTNGLIGTLLRSILVGKTPHVAMHTMALLFAADRYEHIWEEIIPRLEHGHIVCDRYYYSNMAYQSYDAKSLEFVMHHNNFAMEQCRPDITFFINVSPEECMRRIQKRNENRSIFETLESLQLIHTRYMDTINKMKETDNIIIVGSDTATPDEVVKEIWQHIKMKR